MPKALRVDATLRAFGKLEWVFFLVVVAVVFVAAMFVPQIFFGVFLKCSFATGRAKIVGFALVFIRRRSRFGIHFHATYGIDFHEILLCIKRF